MRKLFLYKADLQLSPHPFNFIFRLTDLNTCRDALQQKLKIKLFQCNKFCVWSRQTTSSTESKENRGWTMARYIMISVVSDGRTDRQKMQKIPQKNTLNSKYRKYKNDFYSVLFILLAMETILWYTYSLAGIS